VIRVESLVKKFQYRNKNNKIVWRTAVDGLTLDIRQGEVFGLLGPNGAGKTTTIRMLTMLTEPTSGEIFYDNTPIRGHEQEMKQLIGVVPQHINFDQDLTVGENLELHARLHHMGRVERHRRIEELLAYVELADLVNANVRELSGGMKRRLLIARALIHHPRILFLDEPTVALDPQVRRRIWELIRQLAREQVTVLLTTHYIEEAETLCERVAILNKGRLIGLDTPQAFCEQMGRYTVEWDAVDAREYRFFDTRREAADFMAELGGSASIRRSNLEDVFIELTGRREGL
jgi:ABC-2 type transport system ATP-binding protein